MANEFIIKEVKKVFTETKGQDSVKAAMAVAWICAHFKAFNIKIFDVSETSSLTDYYIICSAENTMQAKSLTDEVIPNSKKHGFPPVSIEGMQDGEWILLDLGDVMLHVFQEGAREIYALDQLWASHTQLDIPQSFFTGSGEEVVNQSQDGDSNLSDEKSYF